MKKISLDSLFKLYNRKYFNNKLKISGIRFGRLKYLGETVFFDKAAPIITISNKLKAFGFGRIIHLVLLHEMIHAEGNLNHNKKFIKSIRKLVRLGAYDNIL